MTEDSVENASPVDFVIIEFPPGEQNFSGEVLRELVALIDSGTIRLVDGLVITKDVDGAIEATELSELEQSGPLDSIVADLADFLA